MRRGYDGVEGSIDRNYDEIEGATMTVSGNFKMLSEITTDKEVRFFGLFEYRRGHQH